jgi:protein AaeX
MEHLMPREIAIGGVLMPGLLVWFILSLAILLLFDWVVGRYGLYRFVWHPALFRFAFFVCIFGGVALLLY